MPVYNIIISANSDPAPPTLREVAAAQSNAHSAMTRLCGFARFHALPEADQRAIWRQNAQIIRDARALRRVMRTILEVTLIGGIFGLCIYAITHLADRPATCQQAPQ